MIRRARSFPAIAGAFLGGAALLLGSPAPGHAASGVYVGNTGQESDSSVSTRPTVRLHTLANPASVGLNTTSAISGPEAVEYAENGTAAAASYSIAIPGTPVWSLSGADSGEFDIDSEGVLSFKASPDYEDPTDSDGDNVYKVTVQVAAGGVMEELNVSVTVINAIPVFAPESYKNDTEIYFAANSDNEVETYEATYSDGGAIAFSLSGVDSSAFKIGSDSGVLTFQNPPNYDNPADSGADNIYNISIIAESGGSSASLDVSVTIDRPPFWVGPTEFSIPESVEASAIVDLVTIMLHDPDARDNFDIVDPDNSGNRSVQINLLSGNDSEDADNFLMVPYPQVTKFYYHDDRNGNKDGTMSIGIRLTPDDLDYENPVDTNRDNEYELVLRARNTQVIGSSVSLTFSITVTNSPELKDDDGYETDEDTPLPIAAAGLLENDETTDSPRVTAVGKPANCGDEAAGALCGTVVLSGDGAVITYTPGKDFFGDDSFTYTVSNEADNTATATVSVTVNAVEDDPPTVVDDDVEAVSNSSLTFGVADKNSLVIQADALLMNDTDPDDTADAKQTLSVVAVGHARNGNIDADTDPNDDKKITSITYTPDPGFAGNDRFRYTVSDGTAESGNNIGTVNVVVNPGSSNADLNALTVETITNTGQVSDGILEPVFSSDTTEYTVYVPYFDGVSRIEKVRVTPVSEGENATVLVTKNGDEVIEKDSNGNLDISLNGAGQVTPIAVAVTAQDKTTKIYTINAFRHNSNDAKIYFKQKIGDDFSLLNVAQDSDTHCTSNPGNEVNCPENDVYVVFTADDIGSNKIKIESNENDSYYLLEKILNTGDDFKTERNNAQVDATTQVNGTVSKFLEGESDEIELDEDMDNNIWITYKSGNSKYNIATRITSCYNENSALTNLTVKDDDSGPVILTHDDSDDTGFFSDQFAYTATVPYEAPSVTLQPVTDDGCGAIITVDGVEVGSGGGSESVYLKPGEANAIAVTFVNGPAVTEYTVDITRTAPQLSFEASDIDGRAYIYRTGDDVTLQLPQVSVSDATVRYYTLTSAAPAQQQSLSIGLSNAGLEAFDGTLTLPPGLTYNEDDRTVSGTISGVLDPTNYIWTAVDEHGGTDSIQFSMQALTTASGIDLTLLDASDAPLSSVPEGAGATTVKVKATLVDGTYATAQTVTVTVGADGDTAEEGIDYERIDENIEAGRITISIPQNSAEGSTTFTLTPNDDKIIEEAESLSVNGSFSDAGATVNGATLEITDNDTGTVSIADGSGLEGGPVSFEVTLSGPVDEAVTVAWATSDDTGTGAATAGSDYTAVTSDNLTIDAGNTVGIITVATASDDSDEGAETFTVTLNEPSGGFPAGVSLDQDARSATGTIYEAALSISDATVEEGDSGTTTLSFDVTLSGNIGEAVTVDWATPTTASRASGDTAEPDRDYTAANGRLTFEDGVSGTPVTETIDVTVTGDTVDEADEETFTVTLSEPPSPNSFPTGVGLSDATAMGTIEDDDAAPTGVALTLFDSSDNALSSVLESAGATTVKVKASVEGGTTYATAQTVTVTVGADGDTAEEGIDYEYAPVDDSVTVIVVTIDEDAPSGTAMFTLTPSDDSLIEGDETLTVSGAAASGVAVDSTALTIVDNDGAGVRSRFSRLNAAILSKHALGIADGVSRAVGRRMADAFGGRAAASFSLAGGSTVPDALRSNAQAIADGALTLEDVLAGSSFLLPLSADDGGKGGPGGAVLWGGGERQALEGTDPALAWDGAVTTGRIGIDTRLRGDLLAGLALSRSVGAFDYTDGTGPAPVRGSYESRMTGVHPYLGWKSPQGLGLWGALGYGRGGIEIEDGEVRIGDPGNPVRRSDTVLKTAVLGADGPLVRGGATALALRGEASVVRVEVEGDGGLIERQTVDANRLRLALEGSYERSLASGGTLRPSLEMGLRHDGGDGAAGGGIEVGVGLGYRDPAAGLSVEGHGRVLGGQDDYREWGAGGSLRLDPGAGGRGLSFSLAPSWGDMASGVARLWDRGIAELAANDDAAANDNAPQMRLDSELGYGYGAFGGRGLLTPYSGLSLAGGGGLTYRLGSRIGIGTRFDFDLKGERNEPADDTAPEHSIVLRIQVRW